MSGVLTDKVVLVTGASRGIGYSVCVEAARRGAHVIAVARTVGGLEELDDEIKGVGSSATLVPQNITDLASIDRLGGAIFERWGRLDGLVGNAGALGIISPVPHIDPKMFEKTLLLNLTVNYRLIRSMDPLLRQSTGPGGVRFIIGGQKRAPLLGPLCRLQGGAGCHGKKLCRRDGPVPGSRQCGLSGRGAHPYAGQGHAGGDTRNAARARGSGAKNRRSDLSGV